jgi:beta-lactam-binding protein with PASTA domain
VTLAADASDIDGQVAQVEFFAGATSLGTATSAPFSVTWSDVPAGDYSLTAVATDSSGARTTSEPVLITIAPIQDVEVPAALGLTESAARAAITSAGLRVGAVTTATSPDVAAGLVMRQSPAAGTSVPAGTAVDLVVSAGSAAVTVPTVVGQPQAEASSAITAAGLSVGGVTTANSTSIASGSVIGQTPAGGTSVAPGSPVALIVSLGPANVAVPNVVGQPQAAAKTAIANAGLSVGATTTANSATVTAGSVISQSPAAGTSVAAGSAVALVVSAGPVIPPPTGLPDPWVTQDVGAVGVSGSATFASSTTTYTVTGAGADIWGTADAFRYVYQRLTGDGQIIARVVSVQNTNAWVKAGVMIRADLGVASAHGMMMVTPGKGNNFQRRSVAGGVSTGTAGLFVTAPYWVKLTRVGSTVTAYQSANGSAWSTVGAAVITMPSDVLVGLAVSSHSPTTPATAAFDQVSVGPIPVAGGDVQVPNVVGLTQAAASSAIGAAGLTVGAVTTANSSTVPAGSVISQNPVAASTAAPGSAVALVISSGPPPVVGLPSGWATQDVGATGLSGSASFDSAAGKYSVTAAGADIWGTADAFRYVYQTLSGDGQIVARVTSVQNTNAWVKAGVMIRSDLTPGSAHAMMMVTPGKGNNFQRRTAAGGTSSGTAGLPVAAPYWVKLMRSGATITAYESADGNAWSVVGTATIAMPTDVLVGLALSSHSSTTRATATFESVAIIRP